MKNQVLFIHIPKTAGTSFRFSMRTYLGEVNTFFDYGPTSIETSKFIREFIYKKQDYYALSEVFSRYEMLFLSGHFNVAKYSSIFETSNIITFVRKPAEQVLSHYKHFVSHHGYKQDLISFVKDSRFQNLQSRLLSSVPIELYGFVGITEQYSKSIELINDSFGLNIKVVKTNENLKKDLTVESIGDDIVELIENNNANDVNLYKKAKLIFESRLKCYTSKKPFTNVLLQKLEKNVIEGCAFQKSSNEMVEIDIYNAGQYIASVNSNIHKPGLISKGIPRKGYVGFNFEWEEGELDLDMLSCVVKKTGQIIV